MNPVNPDNPVILSTLLLPPDQRDRPMGNSYWVRKGQFLAGEYPGAKDGADARKRVRAMLDGGVTFFVDLTEKHELDPYDVVLGQEATRRSVATVHTRFPIRDASVPRRAEVMTGILDTIDDAIRDGHVVYVHCWGGIGRTGTVVGCHLVRHGLTGDEALAALADMWKVVDKFHRRPNSPETSEQCRWVREWRES
jgi:protein-tyrosine phosphatase